MVQWKHTINLQEIWKWFESFGEDAKYDESLVRQLGLLVAKKLRKSKAKFTEDDWDALEEIVVQFEDVEEIEVFDCILSDLYDWADEDNKCWIAT